MKSQSIVTADKPNGIHNYSSVLETERKQLKQETLNWISLSALAELRRTWAISQSRT